MGECRETANFVMAFAENLYSNIRLEKLDISTRLLFFAFFQFSIEDFTHTDTITLRGDEVKINF